MKGMQRGMLTTQRTAAAEENTQERLAGMTCRDAEHLLSTVPIKELAVSDNKPVI